MPKLNKRYFYTAEGKRKLNCYQIIIPKDLVYKTKIKEDDDLVVVAEGNELVIRKKNNYR